MVTIIILQYYYWVDMIGLLYLVSDVELSYNIIVHEIIENRKVLVWSVHVQ